MAEYYECDCGCTILRVEYDEEDGEFMWLMKKLQI